ncbi:damage-inducible protein J [Bifidobacterium leontopitheci]|uniref:Damage-inducible protein J n=2 Tax=Bifidobacterium leontopitheci TaxID=2650774 RepID=A0A6I1GMQ8_9BIFI|nr:damage-inducible protein J [Bifidobacterium leontopitheci]
MTSVVHKASHASAAMTQLNVRIDAKLKTDVDDILSRNGVSASDMIRSVWTYIADRREIPRLETGIEEREREDRQRRNMAVIEDSAGYVWRELAASGLVQHPDDAWTSVEDAEPKRRRELMYDQLLDEYLTMERSE